jgi:hypothetical protein
MPKPTPSKGPPARELTKQERTALLMSMAPICKIYSSLGLSQQQQNDIDTPEMIDLAIAAWRKQPANERISEDDLLNGAGFLLGDRIRLDFDLEWAFIQDDYGEFYGLAHGPSDRYDIVVIDPVNSLVKRIDSGGARVAQELFDGLSGHLHHLPRTQPAQPLRP